MHYCLSQSSNWGMTTQLISVERVIAKTRLYKDYFKVNKSTQMLPSKKNHIGVSFGVRLRLLNA